MPIYVDPTIPAPELPEALVSPDGKLYAARRNNGILLKADLRIPEVPPVLGQPEQVLATNLFPNPGVEYDSAFSPPSTSGGTAGTGTVEYDTTTARSGRSLKITSTTDGALYESMSMGTPADYGLQVGDSITLSSWVYIPVATTTGAVQLRLGGSGVTATNADPPAERDQWVQISLTTTVTNVTGTLAPIFYGGTMTGDVVYHDDIGMTEGTVPIGFSGDTPTSGDVHYRWTGTPGAASSEQYTPQIDAAPGIPAHLPAELAGLRKVRFSRADGTLVRSGHDAWAPGGIAYAFDNEAEPGSTVAYTARPVFKDGTLGDPTEAVAITTAGIGEDSGCWLKSIEQPHLSMALEQQTPDPETSQESRDTLTEIPGSPYPAGGWDIATAPLQTFTFKTYTKAEHDQLLALLDSGPLLWQGNPIMGIDPFYCLRKTVQVAYQVGAYDPRRLTTVGLQPIARPPTLDAPMAGAGRSYNWLAGQVTEYDQIPQIWPRYSDIVESGITGWDQP